MKFSVKAERLRRALNAVKGAIAKKPAMPILAQVLLRVAGDRLTVTGTDLELAVSAEIAVRGECSGAVAVNHERLSALVKALPDIDIAVTLADDRLKVRAGTSRIALGTLPCDSFPELEADSFGPPVTLPAERLAGLLEQVTYAMAKNDVRYFLNGIQLQMEDGLIRMVASDGHRLAYAEATVDGGLGAAAAVIVPRTGALELAKALTVGGEAALSLAPNAVRCGLTDLVFTVKLIDGQYPDWRRIVPRAFASSLSVDRQALLAALRRVAVVADAHASVRLDISPSVIDLTAHTEHDAGSDKVEATLDGDPQALAFNGEYLIAALEHISSATVVMDVAAGGSSAVLRDPDSDTAQHIVMPMRL